MTNYISLMWTITFGIIAIALWPLFQLLGAFLYFNPWYPFLMGAVYFLAYAFQQAALNGRTA